MRRLTVAELNMERKKFTDAVTKMIRPEPVSWFRLSEEMFPNHTIAGLDHLEGETIKVIADGH